MKLFASFGFLVAASASTHSSSSFLQHEPSLDAFSPTQVHHGSLLEELAPDPIENTINLAVEWSEESHFPLSVQYLFASTWIIMIALVPLLLPIMEKKPPTRTQLIVGAAMMAVLFGGVYLFTNIIVFQSVHFKKIRTLTVVECIYFMAQVITTVGYGDVTPAMPRGQVFVGLYVLGALFIIAMVISNLTEHMCKMGEEYEEKQRSEDAEGTDQESPLKHLFTTEKPSVKPLMSAFLAFLVLDICWIVFFAMHPGEGKDWFQATYMSVVTLSTVGFGWFTPVTESGMIFGAFWMLFGSAALVNVIGEFTALMIKLHQYELAHSESQEEAMSMLKSVVKPGSQDVTEYEFMRFGLLQLTSVTAGDLDNIQKAFDSLGPQKGRVPLAMVEQCVSDEYQLSPTFPVRKDPWR